MELKVGEVFEGKVSGIAKFGAFVALPGGGSGLVHISELADTFVKNVGDFVQVGQTVKVKVVGISGGKVNLSIKQAEPAPQSPAPEQPPVGELKGESDDRDFEDKLKRFMQDADSRIAGNPMYADRGKQRRRR